METKKFDLSLNKETIFTLQATNANLAILFGSSSFVEYSFSNFGNISPELNFDYNSNKLNFKNSELIELSINLYLPEDIKGIDIQINKGNIFLTNGKGDINITTYKGDIKIENVDGNLKIDSFDGNLDIFDIKGGITIKGENTQIKIKNWLIENSSDISTNYGSIYIETEKIKGDLNIKTNSGKISFGIQNATDYYILARGKDVVNFLGNREGRSLGSPAEISAGNKQRKINIFSRTDKVLIANSKDLETISPDIVKIFEDFDNQLAKSIDFNKIYNSIKNFSKKAEDKTKTIFGKISSFFSKQNEKKEETKESNVSEKQQILNLLKEGKITPEEAERLLKALK